MSNTNNNLQTQTLNALHNAIMEAGGKDRPPMLAPDNYNPPYKFKWTEKTVPVAEGSSERTTEGYIENYKNVLQDIWDQLNDEAEVVQIILTGIDNDIYSTVDACPNACEMWKAIEGLKQGSFCSSFGAVVWSEIGVVDCLALVGVEFLYNVETCHTVNVGGGNVKRFRNSLFILLAGGRSISFYEKSIKYIPKHTVLTSSNNTSRAILDFSSKIQQWDIGYGKSEWVV
ncbi:hypothetical protein Tco_0850947 [Tanacetum coccineum]